MNTALHIGRDHYPFPRPIAPILDVLKERGANRAGHGRGTVLGHLMGTHDVLAGWGQPERVCLAGLVHNAYSTDAFDDAMFDPSERSLVRDLIGADAERLVHQFGGLSRTELFSTLESIPPGSGKSLTIPDRRGGPPLELTTRDVGDLLVLYLANVADQAAMSDGGPTYWLAPASQLAVLAAPRAEVVPLVFNRCRSTVSTRAEEEGLESYDTALRLIATDRAGATERLERASRHIPWVGEPLIWLSALYRVAGEDEAARVAATRGAALIREWGTPWDKRLTLSEWTDLSGRLASQGDDAPSLDVLGAALDLVDASPREFAVALARLGGGESAERADPDADTAALPARFRTYLARQASDPARQVGIGIYPGLPARPWYPAADFPIARSLETAAPTIAEEFAALRPELLSDETEDIARTGRWSVLFLEKDGVRQDKICDLCPATASVLEAHRQEIGGAGVAYFSCLDPGTRVAPHRGATNTRLRLHLGLEIPPNCGVSVGGVEGRWQEGSCLVFDDSFIHSVWNESDRRRVVLIVDLWHPDLTAHEVALLQWLAS